MSATETRNAPAKPDPAAPDVRANAKGVSATLSMYGGRRASHQLHIIIVGCGLGGLAAAHCLAQAGHRISMYEAASAIGEVGAGIQVSPNVSRLLQRWGVGKQLDEVGVKPEAIVLRRYSTGERVGYTKWAERMEEHGAPYYHIHRADFHKLLFDLAAPHIDLHLNSTVVEVDPSVPSIMLADGTIVSGDLLIGADGVKSLVQKTVLGKSNPAQPTGDAAYRALIPTELLLQDPELKGFVEVPEMTGWMGPKRHLMAYNIRGKKEFNIVLIHPDDGSVESWTAEGSADKMRKDFEDFEPRVQKMLSHVQFTLKWRLMDRQPLDTWIHPDGKVALLGDSCHPMLPYRAQGAAMAIEDAAVLGSLLSRISHPAQLHPLLLAYQSLRLPRTAETQASSRLNQKIFHYEDGPEQEARDADMKRAMEVELVRINEQASPASPINGHSLEGNANQWADQKKNEIQFGYDADEVADKWWREVGERAIGNIKSDDGKKQNRLSSCISC